MALMPPSSDGFATWQATVPLTLGSNTLTVSTGDIALNSNDNAAQAVLQSEALMVAPENLVVDSDDNRVLRLTLN